MLYLDPESVDLSRLGEPPHQGVGGRDPREATRPMARSSQKQSSAACADWPHGCHSGTNLCWKNSRRRKSALVNRQLSLASSEDNVWAGSRKIGQGVFSDYGRLLAEEKFDGIEELTRKL